MQLQIITIYCLCADFLIAYGYKDDKQARVTNAEIMTIALVAAWLFYGNQESSRRFLIEHGYIPQLSKSRFNRRLHAIPEAVWQALFSLLAEAHLQCGGEESFSVDSMPIPVCDNIRIRRCRLYRDPAFRGYSANKRRYYYGLKVHLVVTASGKPVEFLLTPGSVADMTAFKAFDLAVPEGADLYADRAYTDYAVEDLMRESCQVTLVAQRKYNSKRPHPPHLEYLCQQIRKRIETTFSGIESMLPKHIHAVTPRGIELKVFLTVLAFSMCR